MLGFFQRKPVVWIVSDGTDSVIQSRSLAQNITSNNNIFEFDRLGANSNKSKFPDLAIGVGYNVADILLGIKERSSSKTKITIILDPLKDHQKFDFIILPSYEPYGISGENVIRTTDLINFVTPEFLNQYWQKNNKSMEFEYLNEYSITEPFSAFLIGGKHTGGNISKKDVSNIAGIINSVIKEKGGTALISTSKRTEAGVTEALEEKIDVPYFLYDYNKRHYENPYKLFLTLADEIFVTGDSVRMMCEAISSGKKVNIYKPAEIGFQYEPLIKELIKGGYAFNAKKWDIADLKTTRLNEAERVGKVILSKLGFEEKVKKETKPKEKRNFKISGFKINLKNIKKTEKSDKSEDKQAPKRKII